jgi:hypothetical protein
MWIINWLPETFIHIIFLVGVLGTIAGFVLGFLPFVGKYKLPIQIVSIILFCLGLYWYGGYSNEMLWRERVAEMEAKVAAAEAKNKETNNQIEIKIVERTKVIREKGKTQIEYINRLVEGKTVEIVKDMSAEERAAFETKQKELLDAIKNCPVPKIIVEEQNKAAAQK